MNLSPRWYLSLWAMVAPVCLWGRPEVWFKVELPRITLISDLPRDQTEAWAIELHQFEDGICFAFKIPPRSLSPLTVLAFQSDREFSRYKPLKNGKPIEVSGYFARTLFSNVAAVSAELGTDDRQSLYHEATHWITYSSDTDLPLWLAEGLAEAYSTFSLKEDTFTFGDPPPGHVHLLNTARWIPVPKLLDSTASVLNYSDSNRTSLFYAEAWLACHYLVFGDPTGAGLSHIGRYQALRATETPDSAFRDAFGLSPVAFGQALKAYANQGKYRPLQGRFLKPEAERTFHVEVATAADVEQAEGELLLGSGRVAEARTKLEEVLTLNPKRGRAMKLLGMADLIDGHLVELGDLATQGGWNPPGRASDELRESAIVHLNRAVDLGETDTDTLLAAGEVLTMERKPNAATAAFGGFGTGQARRAADLFEYVAHYHPSSLRAARGLAGIVGTLDPLAAKDAAAMRAAAQRFTQDTLISIGSAIVDLQAGPRLAGETKLQDLLRSTPPLGGDLAAYAQSALAAALKLDRADHLNGFLKDRRFAEAMPLIDAELAEATGSDRAMLENVKRLAQCALDMERLAHWMNSGRAADARPELQAIASDPSLAPFNQDAARLLRRPEVTFGGTEER